MEITWFGHSCFRIKGKEALIVTDPCSPDTGYVLPKMQTDLVTISHDHPGHNYLATLQDGYKLIKGPGEYEIKDIYITGIATSHGSEQSKNTVYIIEFEGVTLCHLGDLGQPLSPEVSGELGNINVLFVPVGGGTTLSASAAADLVRNLNPGFVVPMNYKTATETAEVDFPEKFLKELGIKELPMQPKLVVTRTNLSATMHVVLLDYAH